MKVIARPVGTGKTKELLETALKTGGTVLTTNKRALKEKARAYGMTDICIVDWSDLLYNNFDASKPLYVNKLDDAMEEYFKKDFGLQLAGYSVAMG